MKHVSEAMQPKMLIGSTPPFNLGSELVWKAGSREGSLNEATQEGGPEGFMSEGREFRAQESGSSGSVCLAS
jgi:hypothetical protein